jgi:ribosomal protein S13
MKHLYDLAAELARPVETGHLTRTDADAALLGTTLRWWRGKKLNGLDPIHVYRGQRHILGLHLQRLTIQRQVAEGQARMTAWRARHGR